jgi:thiamine biosynthesis lipoprotein
MAMPVVVEIVGGAEADLSAVFDYFTEVDERFSVYKPHSEISKINRGELHPHDASKEMQEVFALSEKTREESGGYFSITKPDGTIDPSGLVKGWAIQNAAQLVERMGYHDYYVEVAGDIQTKGVDKVGQPWSIGIRNPFNRNEIVKVLYPKGRGVATSGTAVRGQHIYNPHDPAQTFDDVVSLTVVGPTFTRPTGLPPRHLRWGGEASRLSSNSLCSTGIVLIVRALPR